jgi:lipoyl(octanoyl) transferase
MDSEIKGVISWEYLGRVGYADGLRLQNERRERLRREGPASPKGYAGTSRAGGYLLLLEHNPVITDGRFGKGGNIILQPEELEKRGVETYKTERGGDVTFHGPGQLVAYPIIDLRAFGLGAKAYVRALEETIIRLLADYDIKGISMEKFPGVWAYGGKIASIGVSVRNGITMHGCAFNVNTDLSWFSMIIPCGIEGVMITSIKDILAEEMDFGAVMWAFVRYFGEVFRAEMREGG